MIIRPILLSFIILLKPSISDGAATLPLTLDESRIQGGLCVIVGAKDHELAAELARTKPFVVQCLMKDEASVSAMREALLQKNLHGPVTADVLDAKALPFADHVVSLLIVHDARAITEAERLRVLRPFGEMIIPEGAGFRIITKPRTPGTDDWTHWRHGADRNPVSHDTVVDVPQRVQWLLPDEAMSERSHLVCANGRMFTQDKETLTARDACNGLPLWQAKLKKGREFDWEWTVKVAALIVAVGERVYALTDDDKFKALDAATGKAVIVYENAETPSDVVFVEGGTLVLANAESVRALNAETGALLWKVKADNPRTLIASADTAFFIEGQDRRGAVEGKISAVEIKTGKFGWQKTYDWARRTEQGAFGNERIVYEIRTPSNWKELYEGNPKLKEEERYALAVISAKTGELIETVRGTGSSARHGEFRAAFWHRDHLVTEAVLKNGINVVQFSLDDFKKPSVAFRANDVGDRGFGHCYPPVLTDRFYLNGQMNFTDLASGSNSSNPITRGSCNTARSGYVPANGLIYTFPKHCVCYPMLDGNVALAPQSLRMKTHEHPMLTKGTAWPARPQATKSQNDWPTFRHDASRTGGTTDVVPAELKTLWTAEIAAPQSTRPFANEWEHNGYLAGAITAPVIADGLVFIAQSDSHRIIALDAATGKERWHFFADGRVDSPPTIHEGMCLFGSRSGWVFNLRASDGVLIWKLRLAPNDERITVNGQVESACPVPGSVLVVDGLAYAAAGLHPNSDGGIRVVCFDPATARIVWENKFDDLGFNDPWPEPYDPRPKRPDSDPWRTIRPLDYRYFDLPVRDGDGVAISRCVFDLKTGKRDLRKTKGFYQINATGVRLPRTVWRYGTQRDGAPTAVSLGSSVFGTVPAKSLLFRADFTAGQPFDDDWVTVAHQEEISKSAFAINKVHQLGAKWETSSQDSRRSFNRAMLVAADHLFTVTPHNVLTVHDTTNGTKLAEQKLEAVCWDGLAAAGGKLFISTARGKVLCLGDPGSSLGHHQASVLNGVAGSPSLLNRLAQLKIWLQP